ADDVGSGSDVSQFSASAGNASSDDSVATPAPTPVDSSTETNEASPETGKSGHDLTPSAADNPSFSLPGIVPKSPVIKNSAGGYLTAPSVATSDSDQTPPPPTSSAPSMSTPADLTPDDPVSQPASAATNSTDATSQQVDEQLAKLSQPAGDNSSNSDPQLLQLKTQALQELTPLLAQLDQTPEEKFRTTMMMIQAADNQSLIPEAYQAAHQITDEKARGQALLDVVNEINYFTQKQSNSDSPE
ncbi:MAG: hypothetical protein ACREGA_02075, partial [Candidatus Saccharimonadales bacterium]